MREDSGSQLAARWRPNRGVQHVDVGPDRVVLWHVPGQVSALDTEPIPDGAEIGSVAEQTGSVWNLFGRAPQRAAGR